MGIVNNQPSVIHLLSEADFSANTYFKVFALTAEAVTINGTATFTLATGIVLDIAMRTITAGTAANIVVMGTPKPYDSVKPYNVINGVPIG
jgi:hypothetical protein|tara:strand:+ start:733 stop:1005 length:273 start_codon:yes stop_codon:yes gene_type:complete